MGRYEAELRGIVTNGEILSDLEACLIAIPKAVEHLDTYATVFRDSSEFPGLKGDTGTMVSELFTEAETTAATNSKALASLVEPLDNAVTALLAAQISCDTLPDTTIPAEYRAAILGGASLLFPGIGLLGGHLALEKYEEYLKQVREKAAKDALAALEEETYDPSKIIYQQKKKMEEPARLGGDKWDTEDGPDRHIEVLPPQPPGPGSDANASDPSSGSWDEPIAAPTMVSPGGVAAGVVGAGAIAGLGAGLGKIGGGTANPGTGGPGRGTGGGGQGLGGGGIGSGSRVSADSARTISSTSSSSGGGMKAGLSGGLSSGRSGLGGAGTGVSGGAGIGMAGSGSAGGTGLAGGRGLGATGGSGTGAAGGAGNGGMMMGGGGGAAGSEKDKSRTGLGYRAPKIEAPPSDRRRPPTGREGSRADFPETPPQPTS